MLETVFEKEVCSRCAGTGQHSWCQMYGSRCFKCNGLGETLTKKGAAARAYLDKISEVKASELAEGDLIVDYGAKRVVKSVSILDGKTVIETSRVTFDTSSDTLFVTYRDRASKIKEALAYQESLTKTGKPRKGSR
jgi:uncharacterized protein YuzE